VTAEEWDSGSPTVTDAATGPIWRAPRVASGVLRDTSALASCCGWATVGEAMRCCDPEPSVPAVSGVKSGGDESGARFARTATLGDWSSGAWSDFSGLNTVTTELARLRAVGDEGERLLGAGDVLAAHAGGAVGEGAAARDILSALDGEHLAASNETITCALGL
jgi:hypothetical protein